MTFPYYKTSKESGFSLVELAVSLVVIGFLLGVILKGQDIIISARISQTIKHLKAYDAAFTSFYDSYSGLPGDITNPNQFIPNCTTTNRCMPGGNGNGVINAGSEQTNWIHHLALLDLVPLNLTGSYFNHSNTGTNVTIGMTNSFFSDPLMVHHIKRSNFPVKVLATLDQRMDDGKPMTGKVRSDSTACIVSGRNEYNVLGAVNNCSLVYMLQY